MRRGMNGSRLAARGPERGGAMTRRSVSTDENNVNVKSEKSKDDDFQTGTAGPVTARLKMLEKRYSQVLEIQAKFGLLDKWIQQQFGIKLFPPSVVTDFSEGIPEDTDNPFYAVYLIIQRVKFLEEKVKKLESRPMDDFLEPKPTSNYSSAHSFRNFRGGKAGSSGGVKRGYSSSAPTTPKKAKMAPRPPPPSSNYPFKPSVKILPKDPNIQSPVKKAKEVIIVTDESKIIKAGPSTQVVKVAETNKDSLTSDSSERKGDATDVKTEDITVVMEVDSDKEKAKGTEDGEPDVIVKIEKDEAVDNEVDDSSNLQEKNTDEMDDKAVKHEADDVEDSEKLEELQEESEDVNVKTESLSSPEGGLPILEDATAGMDEAMDAESGGDDGELDELEQKPIIPLEEELGDVSGSEASVSSLASSSSKLRLSTRRQAAAAAAASSTAGKDAEEEKPVMYTARGRRHQVPRRYAEFTGHDNVVSILKSQQRAEKSAAGSSKGGKKQASTPTKQPDTPPKIKKMVKTQKTPSPKKSALLTDSDGDGEGTVGVSRKKAGHFSVMSEKPPCVDALVDRVMAREVDSDGMVVLSESYPNIFVNQQQLITVVVRSNGKATRLTRKMTTLVFEDSVLASASPFGTKYYKDRLPPEPLEAMVDFIADSGFEPHYTKKKIYMIVGQVCNEARAGRVSRKFMQPLEATPGTSSGTQSQYEEVEEDAETVQETDMQ